jgi:hypothetical protein
LDYLLKHFLHHDVAKVVLCGPLNLFKEWHEAGLIDPAFKPLTAETKTEALLTCSDEFEAGSTPKYRSFPTGGWKRRGMKPG